MTGIETRGVHEGDCLEVMEEMPAESVHAVVTDPPYGLAFMGRDWDDFGPREYQRWCEKWASRALGVLKPGGHLLAFSGNRTHHRLFSGVEDAGFEIRDTITWHYGSGFPKALNVSKAIDKAEGAERETVRVEYNGSELMRHQAGDGSNTSPWMEEAAEKGYHETPGDKPATEAAKRWDGWRTALKPATEYVVVARKPFDGTVAENVQEHGTGALDIDSGRLEHNKELKETDRTELGGNVYEGRVDEPLGDTGIASPSQKGRYPANVVFDARAARMLDAQSGVSVSEGGRATDPFDGSEEAVFGSGQTKQSEGDNPGYGDSGGASRFFYTSKATKAERTLNGRVQNEHPTVKPMDLMCWLIRLVSRDDQRVLDPFIGSGTTGIVADYLGREWIGIEQDSENAELARQRIEEYRPSEVSEWIEHNEIDDDVTYSEQDTLGEYAERGATDGGGGG